jgi:hypothetical protein
MHPTLAGQRDTSSKERFDPTYRSDRCRAASNKGALEPRVSSKSRYRIRFIEHVDSRSQGDQRIAPTGIPTGP